MKHLFQKYDVPVPRYTSYPTVPYWETPSSFENWMSSLQESVASPGASYSLYMHIPYCESLCTFCGCNTVITKDHKKESPYVKNLLQEWGLYLQALPNLQQLPLKHLHLGGGTPTFLSPPSLRELLKPLLSQVTLAPQFEGSVEVDPRRTTQEQLQVLHQLGFRRISLGVQDFNPEVQRLINRLQPFEVTEKVTREARLLGYESVNFDLIYGLAKQTPESMRETIQKTIGLQPDRIALYSLALVPWIKPSQRLFKEEDLPRGEAKRELYEIARNALLAEGYMEIGMDHFAKPTDALARASKNGKLHRNFMGYTDQRTDVLLGLGVSAISETPRMFHQNEKILPTYEQKIAVGRIPSHRGHCLTAEDQRRRQQILEFMTTGHVQFEPGQFLAAENFLKEMKRDGLIEISAQGMTLTAKGRPFLRNACVFFDERLKLKVPTTQVFSSAV